MAELSILIPARNELFLANTIADVLAHIEADTEVIVVLDGAPALTPLPTDPRVRVVELAESIGQRAATNLAARMSEAKYVMKCDAHCAFGQGFDRILIEDMQDDWTIVPKMYNLHAFDWVCECGYRRYQGRSGPCEKCGGEMRREMVWQPKRNPETTAMRFDRDLHFQYWRAYRKQQTGDLVDTMSLLGACWMLTREKYWELGICDEGHGSWGQQGTEVACKTWLSGGRLVCDKRTWFAHMFRTQGGDFGFPFPITGADVQRARDYSKNLWLGGNWPQAVHPLSWLIDKFAPVPGWEPTKGIVYYTDNELDQTIASAARRQIDTCRNGHDLVSVSLAPLDFGRNIVVRGERCIPTMFRQILAGLEASTADIIYLCEHDILYHPSHFEFTPPDRSKVYYNVNVYDVRSTDGHALCHEAKRVSQLCGYRDVLLEHYRKRVAMVERDGFTRRMGFEPGTHGRPERVDDLQSDVWRSPVPNIDIKHGRNLTRARWRKEDFRDQRYTRVWIEAEEVPGWGRYAEVIDGLSK